MGPGSSSRRLRSAPEGPGVEQGQQPFAGLGEDELPAGQAGPDSLEGGTGFAGARRPAHEHDGRLLAAGRRAQVVAQPPVVIALDVHRQHEHPIAGAGVGAVDGGVDAELLGLPLLDRTGPVGPQSAPGSGQVHMDTVGPADGDAAALSVGDHTSRWRREGRQDGR